MNTAFILRIVTIATASAAFALALEQPATAFSFFETEVGEAGGSLATAARVNTRPDGSLLDQINGTLGSRADLYRVYLDGTTFLATTETVIGNYPDTQLYLFDSNGVGLFANDNTPRNDLRYDRNSNGSTIRLDPGILNPGVYYLGVSAYNWDPQDSNGNYLFPDTPRRSLFGSNSTSGAALGGWKDRDNTPDPFGTYRILLKGVRYTSAGDPTPTPTPTPTPSPNTSIPEPSAIAGLATLGAIGLRVLRRKQ